MENERDKLRKQWESKLPPVNSEWSHWWIHAENYCLGVVPGSDLLAALDIIEDNYLNYPCIKASTAKIVDSDLIRKNRSNFTIATLE